MKTADRKFKVTNNFKKFQSLIESKSLLSKKKDENLIETKKKEKEKCFVIM